MQEHRSAFFLLVLRPPRRREKQLEKFLEISFEGEGYLECYTLGSAKYKGWGVYSLLERWAWGGSHLKAR